MAKWTDRDKSRHALARKLHNLNLPSLVEGSDTRTGGMGIPITGEVKSALDHEGIDIKQLSDAGLLVSGTHQINYSALIPLIRDAVSPHPPRGGRSF